METLHYQMNAQVLPSSAKRGERVQITAHLTDIVGEVKNVYLSVPQYGITETLRLQDEGTYTLSYTIPWEAPSGSYDISIYAIDQSYKRGPSSTFTYRIN